MAKAKKIKIEKQPDGKIRLSHEGNTELISLTGKKPENLSGKDLGVFLRAVARELGWVDGQGNIV